MKKFPYLAVILVVFLTISCSVGEDDLEPSTIFGTWERSSTLEESKLDIVSAFVFDEDGTFESRSFLRETNSSKVVGFTSIISGTFVLNRNTLTLNETSEAIAPEGTQQWYAPENELVSREWNYMREIKLALQKNGSQLEMDFGPCPPNALCIGPIIYQRVRK